MKQLDLIYAPNAEETYLFNNLDLSKITEPLTIEREIIAQPEEQIFEKKKSEIIEYEKEEYVALLEKEQEPYIITDSEMKSMSGKFQNMNENAGMYFAFINTGTALKVVPISKWYRFVQKNQVSESLDLEGLEKNLVNAEFDVSESDSVHEIDFEERFDDDEDGENEVVYEKEKKLSSSGKKLQGLMTDLEENPEKKETDDMKVKKEITEDDNKKTINSTAITMDDIKKAFGGKKLSVKELLKRLKLKFKLEEPDISFVRTFLKENCVAEIDEITGGTVLKLKK